MRKFTQWLVMALAMLVSMPAVAQTFVGGRTDFRDETIYFVMTTRFYDGDPMNNVLSWDKQDVQKSKNDPDWRGDFAGLIQKLDYIKALGFTAIWITPITQNASGEDYHGYHSMDFSSVDLRYESRTAWGSSKDVKFKDLIDACHAKGIKVVLDIVLNHTSNFGEAKLNPLFTRNQNIRNQATPAGSLIPGDRLSNNYFGQTGEKQYQERFKFFKNPQFDNHNHYHHYGTGWNWDLPNRWWGQIAGDCVDLNTENNTVAEYLVECYGKFMEMGVDAFRIDTTGHIAPLTFNKQFIPQFTALGEQYKNKRNTTNSPATPFYMFGECCARYGGVIYRDQHNLSSHYYTWKSPQNLLGQYNGSQAYWDTQTLNEGHDSPVGPMAVCEQETASRGTSDNVFMKNGAWHQPDYSQASGFNVIDFPMHYNFNSAGDAVNIANQGDKYYNDASWNVVYVDSHDYCPGPNDGTRFNGGTEQWAENLALMFTFRGIPCIYYGSEIEFMKGKPIDVGGETNKTPRSESGRAYYGMYLEGNVSVDADKFGKWTATGEVEKTLNSDLARHITRLNLIRMAVPALRRGQYTFDGCSANGGWAFKRATNDSYALVAINGGATFTNVPAGTYVDLVTGTSYTPNNGTITVNANKNKGQLRVLVKGWTGGKVGEDGKFIYGNSAVSKGNRAVVSDPGTTQYYTADDVIGSPCVKFSPAGGSFRTATQTVTVSLNESATSGWYKVGNGSQVNLTPGASKTFTIGEGMNYGESVSVSWLATDGEETYTGTVAYKKVDPNAGITIYVTGKNGADISGTNLHAWNDGGDLTGGWPGKTLTDKKTIGGREFYYYIFDVENVNVIFNRGGAQTGDIKGLTEDTYFEYDGGSNANKIPCPGDEEDPDPFVTLSPNGGNFTNTVSVTATAKYATSAWYKIGNGSQVTISGSATFNLGADMAVDETVTVYWSATNAKTTKTGQATFKKIEQGVVNPDILTIDGDYNLAYEGSKSHVHYWSGSSQTTWPGVAFKSVQGSDGKTYKCAKVFEGTTGLVFNNNGNDQTSDLTYKAGFVHNDSGATAKSVTFTGNGGGDDPEPPISGMTIYYDNSETNWGAVSVHYWGNNESIWPGIAMTSQGNNIYKATIPEGSTGVVFNNGDGSDQTVDGSPLTDHLYKGRNERNNDNKHLLDDMGTYNSGVDANLYDAEGQVIEYYNIQGIRVDDPTPGVYIMRRGNEVKRVIVH